MDQHQTKAAMPKYKCHKEVRALKILEVSRKQDGTATLIFEENGYAPFVVSPEYVIRHNPQAGGYYVVYEEGYASFSPAEAFETGYTRI